MILKTLEGVGLMATSTFYSQFIKNLSEKLQDISDYIFVLNSPLTIMSFVVATIIMTILGAMFINDISAFAKNQGVSTFAKILLTIGFIFSMVCFAFGMTYHRIQPVMDKDEKAPIEHAYIDKSVLTSSYTKSKQTKEGVKVYQDEGIRTLLSMKRTTHYIIDVVGVKDFSEFRTGDKITYKTYEYQGKKVVHILDRQKDKMKPLKEDVIKKGQLKVKTLTREQGDITKLNGMDIEGYKVLGNESSGIFNQEYLMKKVKTGDVLDVELIREHNNVYDNKSIKINKIKRGGETIK